MFSVRYEFGIGWYIQFSGRRWSSWNHDTEWEAIDELAESHPTEAEYLDHAHQMAA